MAERNKDIPKGITLADVSKCSVADIIEFESWPKERQLVAAAYFDNIIEGTEEIRNDGFHVGYNLGYQAGYRAGCRKAEGDGKINQG